MTHRMTNRVGIPSVLFGLLCLPACQDGQAPLPTASGPELAPPQPAPGTGPILVTLQDLMASGTPTNLLSDGRGAYVNAVCGVTAHTADNGGVLFAYLSPASTTPAASCGGARRATVRMSFRHLSDDPHVDDTSRRIEDLALGEIAVGVNGVAKVNAPTLACFHLSKGGRSMSGIGMRFNSAAYPGSSYLNVTVTGDRLWHVETAPYPDNIGYCEGDLGISFWHMQVSLDITPAN